MINKAALIGHIAGKAGDILSGEKSRTREDIEANVKAIVSSTLARFDLVTRDEFETQVAVLKHTRERLEALEKEVETLKKQSQPEADTE